MPLPVLNVPPRLNVGAVEDERAGIGVAAAEIDDAAVDGRDRAGVGENRGGDVDRSAADRGTDHAVVREIHGAVEQESAATDLSIAGEAGGGLDDARRGNGEQSAGCEGDDSGRKARCLRRRRCRSESSRPQNRFRRPVPTGAPCQSSWRR